MENFVAVRNILECVFKTFKKKIKNIQPRPRGGGGGRRKELVVVKLSKYLFFGFPLIK